MSAAVKATANDNALVLEWPAELLDQAAAEVRAAERPRPAFVDHQVVDEIPPVPPPAADVEPAIVTPGTEEFIRAQREHHAEIERRYRRGEPVLPGRLAVYDATATACTCAYCFGGCSCRTCRRLAERLRGSR